MPKYRVKADPYYIDSDDGSRYYDLSISAGDIVDADLAKADPQGDVYASSVVDYHGDWINPDCLEEIVEDWRDYTPDGLTPIEGDEVVGKLFYQNDEIVKGIVTWALAPGDDTIRITITEGPEGNIGDTNRAVHRTRILKSAGPNAPRSKYAPTPEPLAEWERELLSANGEFLLVLTEDELRWLSDERRNFISPEGISLSSKAKALLPKPKTVLVAADKEAASYAYSALLGMTDSRIVRYREALRQSIDIKGL